MEKKFKKKNIFELRKMSLHEIENYYLELRKYNYDNNIPLKNIQTRKLIHKILLDIIKLDRIASKEKLEIIGDKRIDTSNPKIYACTHIGGNDVQRAFEAINEHAYLFIGDLKELYIDMTGVILFLNGAICLETGNKEDRKIAFNRSIELLKNKGNLLIYPEGAWNITPNLPVMDLYDGVIKMASITKADIIPMAIEQYDDKFLVTIGENIIYDEENSNNIELMKRKLVDCLSTLKWDIWEKIGVHSRETVATKSVEQFQQEIIERCPYDFTVQDVIDTKYKDKNKVSPEDAYIVSPERQYTLKKKYSNDK